MRLLSLGFLIVLGLAPALRAQPTPVGRWKTIDDATRKEKSVVVIWEEAGRLNGRIEQILNPSPDNPEHKCIHCFGDLKDKPLIGLRILTGLRKDSDQWSGGRILDPDNGKFYKCFIAVVDGGKRLKVRGFIGVSLLGRTQYWIRDE